MPTQRMRNKVPTPMKTEAITESNTSLTTSLVYLFEVTWTWYMSKIHSNLFWSYDTDLVNEEPSREEEANGQEDDGEGGIDARLDRWDITTVRAEVDLQTRKWFKSLIGTRNWRFSPFWARKSKSTTTTLDLNWTVNNDSHVNLRAAKPAAKKGGKFEFDRRVLMNKSDTWYEWKLKWFYSKNGTKC